MELDHVLLISEELRTEIQKNKDLCIIVVSAIHLIRSMPDQSFIPVPGKHFIADVITTHTLADQYEQSLFEIKSRP